MISSAVAALAAPSVKMAVSGDEDLRFTQVGLEEMRPFAETFDTLDLNFKDDGITRFTGIRLSRLVNLAGGSAEQPLTVIGSDQYLGYIPKKILDKGYLVWAMNGSPVPGLKGGPLKVVFSGQSEVHPACFTWYVRAMVAGGAANARLSVGYRDKIRTYSQTELEALSLPLDPSMLSIAQGCRNAFDPMPKTKNIRAVPLSRLLPESAIKTENGPVWVEFLPFVGPGIKLNADILKFPLAVVVSCDGRPVHPALGGPFSVVFPVETHPELAGRVPESGALFFVEKVMIR